jgi:hypothetical protein
MGCNPACQSSLNRTAKRYGTASATYERQFVAQDLGSRWPTVTGGDQPGIAVRRARLWRRVQDGNRESSNGQFSSDKRADYSGTDDDDSVGVVHGSPIMRITCR